ncbi:uncharacterized protein [Haliaeetus albicilla]|uniref:uncharacterized protein isoform X2 n=1 Tax=Haliaeetus albicilla TaxID=8969 RepID=UPI0037E97A12
MRSVAREQAGGSQGCGHITSPSPGLQGPHGQAAWPAGAEVEAAPARRVPVAPLALRDSALGAVVALEAGVVPAVLLQELLGRRLPGHRGAWHGAAVESGKWQPGERGGGGGRGFHFCAGAWAGRAVAERQRCGDASEAMLERLEALEADVRFLCTELGAEKLLWSSRFLELLQEQQGLRQRERPRWWDSGDSPELLGEAEDQSASGSEGESLAGHRWMEPRWQPAPCPGSLLGPAAPRQAEGCQPGPAPSCPILPSPARSAELQPVPRSRNQPGGSSGQAAVSWAAQGRSQSPLARGHPWD